MTEPGGEISIKRPSDIAPIEPVAPVGPTTNRSPRENSSSQIFSGSRREKSEKKSGLDDNVGKKIDEAA